MLFPIVEFRLSSYNEEAKEAMQMREEDARLEAHLTETAQRADRQDRVIYTDFLSMADTDVLLRCANRLAAPFELFGGHDACERQMAAFCPDRDRIIKEAFPIQCVRIAPLSRKFAQELTHRDFLGSILGLGIKRETVGDLFVKNSECYAFATDVMAAYIRDNMTQVSRTDVHAEFADGLPDGFLPEPQYRQVNVPSERLDALIGAVYHLSRSQCSTLIAQGKVFVDARLTENTSKTVAEGSVVSVRGFGRFRYLGTEKVTRKDRLAVGVAVY